MAESQGKKFENQIKAAFEKVPETYILRLIDPQNGYAGVRNVCDFIAYKYPILFLIECKSHHGKSISIYSNDPKHKYGDITNNQWEGMLKVSDIQGICAGIYIWYVDYDQTWYVPIKSLDDFRNLGNKSLSVDDISKLCGVYKIPGKKKRLLFEYDLSSFVRGNI